MRCVPCDSRVGRGSHRPVAVSRRVELIVVFAGGCAGALARVLVAEALPRDAGSWPWATLLVNVAGAFVLGLVVAGGPNRPTEPEWLTALLGPGVCGALTTFSTLQLELIELPVATALAYGAATLAAGFGAVALAAYIEDWRGTPR